MFSMTMMTSKKHEFMLKKHLEEVLSCLRNDLLNVVGHSQPRIREVNGKFKGRGKKIRQKIGRRSVILILKTKEVVESCQE
jgi:hypothetical protein